MKNYLNIKPWWQYIFTMLLFTISLVDISEIHVGPNVLIIVEMGRDRKKMCHPSIC